jgi:hypothetical protein
MQELDRQLPKRCGHDQEDPTCVSKECQLLGRRIDSASGNELFWIVNRAIVLVEECCNDDRCHVAVMQINNKEFFRVL